MEYRNSEGLIIRSDKPLNWEGWQKETSANQVPVKKPEKNIVPKDEPETVQAEEKAVESKKTETKKGGGAVIRPKKGK